MSIKISNKFTKLELFTKDIVDDIDKQEEKNRLVALKHVRKKLKENIGKKGRSTPGGFPGKLRGNLKKGIGFKLKLKTIKRTSAIGSKGPHSHLLEFGHGPGKESNKRPFFRRTLLEENETMIDLMSKRYW